jgi:hypothetical protein
MRPNEFKLSNFMLWLVLPFLVFSVEGFSQGDDDFLTPPQNRVTYPIGLEELCQAGVLCLETNEPAIRALGLDITEIMRSYLRGPEQGHPPSGGLPERRRAQYLTLRLRKMLKFCSLGDFAQLGEQPLKEGRFDERSLFVGELAGDLNALRRFAEAHPEIERLISALYLGGSQCEGLSPGPDASRPSHFWMIPERHYAAAEEAAQGRLEQFLREKEPGRSPTSGYQASSFRAGVTLINSVDNAWNSWEVQVMVDPAGIHLGQSASERARFGVPPAVVALHEFEHVRRIEWGQKEEEQGHSPLEELGPVLMQVVLQDELIKDAMGQPLGEVRAYPCGPSSLEGRPALRLGELANTFRGLISKYGTPERAVMSEEGLRWIRQYY